MTRPDSEFPTTPPCFAALCITAWRTRRVLLSRPPRGRGNGATSRRSHPSIDCYSRADELLNYLYSTKFTTLVFGGKAISVPHFDTLRDAGAMEINHN
eukprot:4511782-Pleurochrysis_carterae.AAC.1